MISFVNFVRIASICVGFCLGTLHGYFSHKDFWPNLNFLLEYQTKLVLICFFMTQRSFRSTHASSPEIHHSLPKNRLQHGLTLKHTKYGGTLRSLEPLLG